MRGDTLVALKPQALKSLNFQIAALAQHKVLCDLARKESETLLDNCNKTRNDLSEIIANKDLELSNNQTEINNLKAITKKVRKKWIKNTLYSSAGAAVVGLIAGILIAK